MKKPLRLEDTKRVYDMNLMLSTMSPAERSVFVMRSGILTGQVMTYSEIGKELGVTKGHICRIDKRILEKVLTFEQKFSK